MVFVNTVREHMFVNSVQVPGSWTNLDQNVGVATATSGLSMFMNMFVFVFGWCS